MCDDGDASPFVSEFDCFVGTECVRDGSFGWVHPDDEQMPVRRGDLDTGENPDAENRSWHSCGEIVIGYRDRVESSESRNEGHQSEPDRIERRRAAWKGVENTRMYVEIDSEHKSCFGLQCIIRVSARTPRTVGDRTRSGHDVVDDSKSGERQSTTEP